MTGWTRRPVRGAAIHSAGRSSRLDPSDWKMRDMFAVCSAKPTWMPRKPNEMFQSAAADWRGFSVTVVAFIPPLLKQTPADLPAPPLYRCIHGNDSGALAAVERA